MRSESLLANEAPDSNASIKSIEEGKRNWITSKDAYVNTKKPTAINEILILAQKRNHNVRRRNILFLLTLLIEDYRVEKAHLQHVLFVYLKNNLLRFDLASNRVMMEAEARNDYLSQGIVRYYFLITRGTVKENTRWNTIKYSTWKSRKRSAKEVQIVHSFLVITTQTV